MGASAHIDRFVLDHLPPADQQPELIFDLPELAYPPRLNAGAELLRRAIAAAGPDARALIDVDHEFSWSRVDAISGRMAKVLVEDMGLVPGNRVLLHGPNSAWTVMAWFAILKAGGVVVATMPMLRAAELATVIAKARISHALVYQAFTEVVAEARETSPTLTNVMDSAALQKAAQALPAGLRFDAVDTAAEDPALIAFTSGTTGKPKGCVHFHRDVLAMADTFGRHVVGLTKDDVAVGTPPIAFTFGLGGLVVFPAAVGAATAFAPRPGFDALAETVARCKATALFTAPTGYRALLKLAGDHDLSSLRTCVSAGEALPAATSDAWHAATGIRIIDGIGSTEMIHVFISARGDEIRPGATGKPVPGYQACIIDAEGTPLSPGETGLLAVRGPTGCRYLDDDRQAAYVRKGWNLTGDVYRLDEDGYFWFVARADDMIISSGYNIGAPEVEHALLRHPAVAEAAVIGVPDVERGQIVKACVVLNADHQPSDDLRTALQNHVKSLIAPYKYPRALDFMESLPKTQTGKLQRFRLKAGT
ncbi:MAG: AMP-binding protein [Alphaproteobacteria bacterium]|jgi:2-aminobenzoate-CoA ligase|nr:AMP-binding protein [Alphaproteobacteria bacterium]MBU2040971.1 AMP-binding protein [Alphaproteobacteria bacterium]MBU2126215.1 AMP-binding protein [Alphaproteobacteria bacterium]MBU2291511.1 AMP-binding protein [Alphaproteobacteria bacterium]MBU2397978.1 AMP-binding protein [Alphaproteobacteria bacterium]